MDRVPGLYCYKFIQLRHLPMFFVVYCREENEVVPQVVQAVLSIPATAHIAVRYTTLQLLGELCEWMDSHPTVIGKCTEQWLPVRDTQSTAFICSNLTISLL